MNNTSPIQGPTFQVSRLMEFFTQRELTLQMGVPPSEWPIAILRELVDNALDAAERQHTPGSLPPEIWVTVEPDALIVQDNGPGLPVTTLEGSLNYLYRVSDKILDVGPSRGQLGIGLKSTWAAPYVSTG